MSKREFKLAGIGFSILCIFSLEFIVQKAWIHYLVFNSREEIIRCYELPKENVESCLISYIETRNELAKSGVNSYLVSIIILAFLGIVNFCFHCKKTGRLRIFKKFIKKKET